MFKIFQITQRKMEIPCFLFVISSIIKHFTGKNVCSLEIPVGSVLKKKSMKMKFKNFISGQYLQNSNKSIKLKQKNKNELIIKAI